jgi:type I restriction enzyme M protein
VPTLRQVLDLLSRDELLQLADGHGVIVGDRRVKAHIADQLEANGPTQAALLAGLRRDRLKELCRGLGLPDAGRDKASLVERLAAEGGGDPRTSRGQLSLPGAAPASPRPGPSSRPPSSSAKRPESGTAPPVTPLTQSELGPHLWEAANILRGSPVDRTDWKSYILPLLFLKRICDVWDEEYQEAVTDLGADFADSHRFQVPETCHWSAVREATRNVGAAIQAATTRANGTTTRAALEPRSRSGEAPASS